MNPLFPTRPLRLSTVMVNSLLFMALVSTGLAQIPSLPRIPSFAPPPPMPQMAPPPPRMDFQSMRIQSEISSMNRMQADSVARQSAQIRQNMDSIRNSMFAAQTFARTQEDLRRAQAQSSWASQQASRPANSFATPLPRQLSDVDRVPEITPTADSVPHSLRPALPLSHLLAFKHLPPGTEFYFPNDQGRLFRWTKGPDASARNLVNNRVAAIPPAVLVIPIHPRN